MKSLMLLEVAIKAIRKNARRSLLTMLGLVIGTTAVITIVSVGRGYEKYQMSKLLPNSDGETIQTNVSFSPADASLEDANLDYFSAADMSLLKQLEGVIDVEYEEEKPSEIYRTQSIKFQNYQQSTKMQLINSNGKQVKYGSTITRADNINQNKVVLISEDIAKEVDQDIENVVGKSLVIGTETFLIIGVYKTSISDTFKLQIPTSSYQYYFGTVQANKLTVTISNQFTTSEIGKQMVELLSKEGSLHNVGTYSSSSGAAMADSLSSLFQSLTLLISFVGAISLFISGVGVMNMIYTSVSERTKEIGIRRALGATERAIQMQFLLEGLTLTFIGGMIGYIIGLLFAKAISLIMNFDFIPDLFTAALAVMIAIFVGLIFSYFPSKSATEKDIVILVK